MYKCLFFGLLFLSFQANGQQFTKYDSTMKIGKAGYRVSCLNKSTESNVFNIRPIGFKSEARDVSLELKGRVLGAEIDDFNMDGFPDLVVYIFDKENKANIFSITSKKNESMDPIYFPDIFNDMQLCKGYRGKDEFKLVEGVLFRKFPIYDTDTAIKIPTNKVRQIMYRVTTDEKGYLKFKSFKSFDLATQ